VAEENEHRRTTRASRAKADIVPTGDPEHEVRTDEDRTADPLAFIKRAQDVLTVKRVYGEPIERNGVTIIPAVSLGGGGGGGGGGGQDERGQRGSGYGGGFGVSAKPAGAFIVRADGRVVWRPALDLNRAILMGQVVAIVFLLTVRAVVKALAKRR
jgi:uncharacterized spore protein YtfJ